MADLTLCEMLRLGGYPAYASFFLGILVVLLIILGFFAIAPYARRRPGAPLVRAWAWVILIAGCICAFNGGVGTLVGMANVHRYAAAAAPAEGPAVPAQGVYEVLFNVAFGFGFALLAFFGYATVRLAAGRG